MEAIDRIKAVGMHASFFDKAKAAIDNGYYFEAIMYEYAAIEGRLEIICGLLGCPCNKDIATDIRRKIAIGNRIECLKRIYKNHPACKNGKIQINNSFWKSLKNWTMERNKYVHGLYKNPVEYTQRLSERERIAVTGLDFANMLYNETKRLRRIRKTHPEIVEYSENRCKSKRCILNI